MAAVGLGCQSLNANARPLALTMSPILVGLSGSLGLVAALFLGVGAARLSKGKMIPTILWGLLLATAIFVLVSGWLLLWSRWALVFMILTVPVAFFLAVLSIVIAKIIAPRLQPRTVRQMCVASACLVLLGTLPIWARLLEMNVFWMADIPSYPGSKHVAKRTKPHEDLNGGPQIQVTYRLPTSSSNALAFYASELGRRGWKDRAGPGPTCWFEKHALRPCRYQFCKGSIRIAFDAASSGDEHVTAPEGPVAIKFIVESSTLPCAPGQPN